MGNAGDMNSDNNISALYNKIIDWFDNARTKDLMEREYLGLLLKHLKPGSTILDLGCGTGEPIAQYFIEKGMQVTGVDGAPKMVELCKQRFPTMEWLLADMRSVDLGKRFDAVIAWDSFFHLPGDDQRHMFTVFKRHIKHGGILLFTSGPKEGEECSIMDGEEFYHASLSLEEYRDLLGRNGFSMLLNKVEDPDCGEHTVWVAKYKSSDDQ